MRIVNFEKVTMENFCCYKNRLEYEFKNDQIILVTGPNGIGKSTIFAAVPYTLFGVSPTGLKADDVVNNEIGKNCYTSLHFNIDSDKYLCERYVKNSKLGNTATLKKNDVLIKKGHTEVVAEIERILIPQKLFFNTLLFGQKVKTFFTDLTDSDQKDIFRKVLQLDDYVLYYDESSNKLKESKKELDKILADINLTVGLIEGCRKQIEQLKESEIKFNLAIKSKIKELTEGKQKVEDDLIKDKELLSSFGDVDFDSEFKVLQEHYLLLNNTIEILEENRKSSIEQATTAKNEKFNSLKAENNLRISELHRKRDIEINELAKEYSENLNSLKLELTNLNNDLENVRKEYQTKIKDHNLLLEDLKELTCSLTADMIVCPLCKQEVGKDNIVHIQKEISLKQEKINLLKLEIGSLKERGIILKSDNEAKNIKYREVAKFFTEEDIKIKEVYKIKEKENFDKFVDVTSLLGIKFNEMIHNINTEFNTKDSDIKKEIIKISKEKEKVSEKINDIRVISDRIAASNNLITNLENLIKSKEEEKFDGTVLKQNERHEIALQDQLYDLETIESKTEDLINMYDFWKTGFSMSGIPSMLIDEAIPFMNERIGYYLDQIGGRYIVSFDTLNKNKAGDYKDKISVNVYDTVTKANMRKQLSGGQTRIVDIATILTLRDLQSNIQDMKTNIIILDEIFDSLDVKNVEYVSTVLRKMTKGNSINIISHTQIDQLDVDDTLRFL